MSNEWNANSRIWENPPPLNPASSATSEGYYGGPASTASPYYNVPPPTHQQQYSSAPVQQYQHPSQMVSGYSFNPASQVVATGGLQQDASLVLKAVNKLNQMGGLDIDPALISELSKHIRNDNASDQPVQPEIYSPTYNSPSPSPERKSSSDAFEVDGKKLVSSRPFYEQFNHYEDDTDTGRTPKVDDFSAYAGRSRSSERRVDRTWAGSVSPPQRHGRSRSPLHLIRLSRYEEHNSSSRNARSRSPVRRTRSKSRENSRSSNLGDPGFKEKVINLLGMSKSENRKFVEAQQSSSVLLVMNLESWITDKVLWGAIHKYAREYGTKPPFYIERASFNFSRSQGDSNLALIAFTTKAAAEMCMMHTKCELEITGRQRKMFKMMYYNENTIIFDALSHKFVGIWRAVLKKRAELLRQENDDDDAPEINERRRSRDGSSHRNSRDKSRDRSSHKSDHKSLDKYSHKSDHNSRNRSRDRLSRRNESRTHITESVSEKKSKVTDNDKTIDNSSDEGKISMEVENNLEQSEGKKSVVEEKIPQSTKPQANIIKTNVLIGKMKSYLIKQNKTKPERDEDDINSKKPNSTNYMTNQKNMSKQDNQGVKPNDPVSSESKIKSLEYTPNIISESERKIEPSKKLPPFSDKKEKSSDKRFGNTKEDREKYPLSTKSTRQNYSVNESKMTARKETKNEKNVTSNIVTVKKEEYKDELFPSRNRFDRNSKAGSSVSHKLIENTGKHISEQGEKVENKTEESVTKKTDKSSISECYQPPLEENFNKNTAHKDSKQESIKISEDNTKNSTIDKEVTVKSKVQKDMKPESEKSKNSKEQAIEIPNTKEFAKVNVQKDTQKKSEKSKPTNKQAGNILNTKDSTKVDVHEVIKVEFEKGETSKDQANIVDTKDITKINVQKEIKQGSEMSKPSKDQTSNILDTKDSTKDVKKDMKIVSENSKKSQEQASNIADTKNGTKVNVQKEKKQEPEMSNTNKDQASNIVDRKQNDKKVATKNKTIVDANKEVDTKNNDKKVVSKSKDVNREVSRSSDIVEPPNDQGDINIVDGRELSVSNPTKTDGKPSPKSSHVKPTSCNSNAQTSGDTKEQPQKKSSVEKDLNESKKLKDASEAKMTSKRKLSTKEEPPRNIKMKKDNSLDDIFIPIEDPESVREREEDEAELFGKGLDKYRKKNRRNRRDDSPYHTREDRFNKRGGYRGGYDNRRLPGHQDKWPREENNFDDIDGNEDSYWSNKRESSKQPTAVNPWIQNESHEDKLSLSLNELRDPEFLLRVLLQTSIMIQNNQLTMTNPLDALTPTDKELIIQTLNEIEATSQVVIYATLNDKVKFNAAENRVLVEALSNIHMFKAALLPPGSLNVNDKRNCNDKNRDFKSDSYGENKREEADVHVQMSNIKHWVNRNHVIRYLRDYNIQFEYVKIYPINRGHTTGFIKFKDVESASELLKRTNRVLYVGNDQDGIQLQISDVTQKVSTWTCNSCSMKNSYDTLICLKCQKLKEKLRDIHITTDVTNRLALINFKITTSVDEIKQIITKVAPFLNANVVAHVDSLSDQVINFLVDLPNPQACSMLKKCIRDNMEEFSKLQAGPRVAISFVQLNSPQQRVYTFEDVPRLAHYSASLYATTEEERVKYLQHYTTLYTQELVLGNSINVVLPEDTTASAPTPILIQNPGVPNGTDDRQWPVPNVSAFTYDHNSGYYYDHFTGLYYESSSQYFYNMETGKFLQYNAARGTYVLVQSSEISSAPVKATASCVNTADSQIPGVVQDDTGSKVSATNKESKIHAKKVLKDLEKWSKTVKKQDKKKAVSNVLTQGIDTMYKSSPADVGFDILQKTETSTKPNTSSVPTISSLIMEHTVCEEEEEEYAFTDWKNFTCNLCHRVFNNADILSKHNKLSELHRNNLKQWYISKNLDPDNEENRKQQYRDRAAERRSKTGGKSDSQSQAAAESWLCSTPGCMSYKKSGFDVCFSCERSMDSRCNRAPAAVPDMSVGSQLLKKMGWEQGTGLGKMGQGSKNPIKVDKQRGYLGLGAQKEECREDGESYASFIKRSTQKRYQELSRRN